MTRKKRVVFIAAAALLLAAVALFLLLAAKKPVFTYGGHTGTSVSETVSWQQRGSFVPKKITAKDGLGRDLTGAITGDESAAPSAPGDHKIVYRVKNLLGISGRFTLTVHYVDDLAPQFSGPDTIAYTGPEMDLSAAAIGLTASDDVDGDLSAGITYSGQVDAATPGDYPVVYTATDSAGNRATHTVTFTVAAAPAVPTGGSDAGSGGGTAGPITYENGIVEPTSITPTVISDPDSVTAVVNKYRALPDGWEPNDLVSITTNGAGAGYLRAPAAAAWEQMQQAAKEQGLTLIGFSAYRSQATQNRLYFNYRASDVQNAAMYSAYPRRSEHELGLAIDIGYNMTCADDFAESAQGRWLAQNAHRYGFVLRYLPDKVLVTQYAYEPWHYRYVGPDLAAALWQSGQTLEEYFGLQ
ncbi:D-alanyl-D-alanine carboxypeptidase family protein [Neobittarella massiliensis]|uniref:D-alanyl-D-alanine carboxypeptidase family protein n=1 Tax=Neobittarella massiliensis (ex Bilen et al. 2018) TaxID=2041842 RepID=A0A8J6LZT4_9FIRM|nr:D-alanyl-D-alanine carboxypeptidase family protein [Neobittarella massiliensis]MBC3516993.1 D-alanyl-D-alanine carboxypeptidase family protein [Neobittarella massiliensis]